MPLISIIIPTYNSSLTIAKCVFSILNQTFDDYEVIIMDGKSIDGTVDIVLDIQLMHRSVVLISEKDHGIYDAMNKGINLAKGKWVYFLGSDDYLFDSLVLQDIASQLQSNQFDLVYGDAIVASDNKSKGGEFTLERLMTNNNMCHQTIFYRRSVFDNIGNYNLNYPIIADWDFNIRCFKYLSECKILYIKRNIVYYNDITGVSSTSRNDPFYKLVPATYVHKLKDLEYKYGYLANSYEYRTGKIIIGFLKAIGISKLIKFFKRY